MLFNSFEFLLVFLPITYAVFWWMQALSSRSRVLASTEHAQLREKFANAARPRRELAPAGVGASHTHGVDLRDDAPEPTPEAPVETGKDRVASARYIWLAVTGYIFYGYWKPWFCLLMLFSTLVSYTAGLGFLRYKSARARRILLVVPITVDLLLLAFFKYANFGMSAAQDILHVFGWDIDVPQWDIILPVGISFYTFHTITYIVDSYRGTIKPTRNLFEFAAYVSLFSQLVAGPIVRFRQLEEDLEGLGHADRTRWLGIGMAYFAIGMVEKVLLADSLANYVDPAFKDYAGLSTFGTWLAVLGYTFQLYFDFCGYSNMAIGLGFMFGLRIPINFNSPYKALNPSDFWQRWHISLSSCLRDYLYIPLGGNRGGNSAMYRNLLLTMLIGGLWHGANWTFIVWGAYHGALLVAYRLNHTWWDRMPRVAQQLLFFLLVVIGWVFFRCETVEMSWHVLTAMFSPTAGVAGLPVLKFGVLLILAGWWAMFGPNARDLLSRFVWKPRYLLGFALVFGAVFAILAGGKGSPFLYFQF